MHKRLFQEKKCSKGEFNMLTFESYKLPAGRKHTDGQRESGNRPSNPENLRPRKTGHRISVLSERLYSIRGQFLGTKGPAKLSVDSRAFSHVKKTAPFKNTTQGAKKKMNLL